MSIVTNTTQKSHIKIKASVIHGCFFIRRVKWHTFDSVAFTANLWVALDRSLMGVVSNRPRVEFLESIYFPKVWSLFTVLIYITCSWMCAERDTQTWWSTGVSINKNVREISKCVFFPWNLTINKPIKK